jgi:SAM-dependent methyltransferase
MSSVPSPLDTRHSLLLYDRIGHRYREYRRPDPRIAALLSHALGNARSVVNVGAGAGSYEPHDRRVIAVEPSRVMIAQRAAHSAPAVQADAGALPFATDAFDCAMAVLTIHHWPDVERGLREVARVAQDTVVLLTWMGFANHFWLVDYLPQIQFVDAPLFPSVEQLSSWLGPVRSITVPIPHDCTDGFLCAYWRRPAAYLDAGVRGAISLFDRVDGVEGGLTRLQGDLRSGAWHARYGDLLGRAEMDFGYRLIIADQRTR